MDTETDNSFQPRESALIVVRLCIPVAELSAPAGNGIAAPILLETIKLNLRLRGIEFEDTHAIGALNDSTYILNSPDPVASVRSIMAILKTVNLWRFASAYWFDPESNLFRRAADGQPVIELADLLPVMKEAAEALLEYDRHFRNLARAHLIKSLADKSPGEKKP